MDTSIALRKCIVSRLDQTRDSFWIATSGLSLILDFTLTGNKKEYVYFPDLLICV